MDSINLHRVILFLTLFLMLPLCFGTDFDLAPKEGPRAQKDKVVLFISQDNKNGGISTLYRHFQVATSHLDWNVEQFNGANNSALIKDKLNRITSQYDAVVLGGIALSSVKNEVISLKNNGVIVVGWHALAEPGSTPELFTNISTQSIDVAKLAVDYVIENTERPTGIVLLNDSRFEIANAKTNKMIELINHCAHCTLLEVSDVNLGKVQKLVPKLVKELNDKYGERWTHTVAINDSYFDFINHPLRKLQRNNIKHIAAGDGSFLAFSRIRRGAKNQVATVAEPFVVQGWQLADELNRAFAKEPPSNFVAEPVLITKQRLMDSELKDIIEYSNCEKTYLSIWFEND